MNKGKEYKTDKLIKFGGIITDKEIPIALLGICGIAEYKIEKIYGEIRNPITLDFLNMVTHKARDRWLAQAPREDGEVTGRMLEEIWADIPNMFNTVVISEYKIKRFFEKKCERKYGDSDFIYKHIKNIGTIAIDGLIPVYYEKKWQRCWHYIDVTGGFAEVYCTTDDNLPEWCKEHKKIIERGKSKDEMKRIYVVRFIGAWGFNFVLNIINDRVRIFPLRFYKELSKKARLLFRMISARRNKRGTFTLSQLQILFGWKGDWGNILDQISKINKTWEELEEKYFIIWSKEENKGEDTKWIYERKEGWFYLPRRKKVNTF